MATIASTVKGAQNTNTTAVPSVLVDVSLQKGRVRRAYDSYTVASADELGTSALINFMLLPAGARIIDASLVFPASGATGTCDVGWTDNGTDGADADGLFASADPGGAAVDAKLDKTRPGYNQKFSEETQIQMSFSEITADSGGDTIELEVLYVVD